MRMGSIKSYRDNFTILVMKHQSLPTVKGFEDTDVASFNLNGFKQEKTSWNHYDHTLQLF